MTGSSKEQPFDERAALAELERFRRDIERHRARREAVGQQFNKFIESFPAPEDVFPSEAAPAARAPEPKPAPVLEAIPLPPLPKREVRTPPAATPPAPVSDVHAAPAPPRPSPPVAERPKASPPVEAAPLIPPVAPAAARDSAPAAVVKPPRKNRRTPIFAALILILLVGAFAMWTFRRGASPPEQQPTSTPAPAPAQPSAAQPAAPPAAAVESEITTLRRAWVRVVADGERVIERELPANSRIPFKADKAIVVRTGDAGAVKLSIRGQDQGALGRDGQVVTRTFTVPSAPPR